MRPKERRDSGQTDHVPRPPRPDRRYEPRAGEARAADRLAVSGGAVRRGLFRQAGPAAAADPADGGLGDPEAHARSLGRSLCERWLENPYFQLFCGEEFFQHKLTFDRSSLTRWRQRMGEDKLVALIQESLNVATRTGAAKPADFSKVIVDTTVQPKAVAFPTDAKLMHRARERLVPAGQEAWRRPAPVLRAGRQARADRPSALRPRQAVQARQPGAPDPAHLSRPGAATSCARSRATRRSRRFSRSCCLLRIRGAASAA